MKKIILKRVSNSGYCTMGVLIDWDDGIPFLVSLELPYISNQTNISSIPVGWYPCVKYKSRKFELAYKLKDVPNRTDILIHPANTVNQLKGCISVGLMYSRLDDKPAVISSKNAVAKLNKICGNEFLLKIE